MIDRHLTAIKRKKWFFVSFAIVAPTYHYSSNRQILDARVKELEAADEELDKLVECSFGQCL